MVSTPDLASAHRIFSVMNARGLDLSPADVLKSDVIGQIRDDWREDYARKWEDAEEDLGRAEFASLRAPDIAVCLPSVTGNLTWNFLPVPAVFPGFLAGFRDIIYGVP